MSWLPIFVTILVGIGARLHAADTVVVRQLAGINGAKYVLYVPHPTADGKNGLIVHLYGTGGTHRESNISQPAYADFRRIVAERGYWIAVPELGPLPWMNDSACASVDALIAEVTKEERIEAARVHLFGTSMGGSGALMYIMARPGKIRSAVAVFPITDFFRWPAISHSGFETAHHIVPEERDGAFRRLSPLYHVDAFRDTPLYLLHGGADTVVPPLQSRDFAAALKAKGFPVTYREVPKETHRDEIAEAFQSELADYLTKTDDP